MGSSKKDEPDAPRPPDPGVTADAQSQANIDALNRSAQLNRYDQSTPYGSVTWDRPTNDPATWSQQVALSPEYQQRFNNENEIATGIQGAAMDSLGNMPQGQFNTQGLPEMQTSLNQGTLPQLESGLNTQGLPEMRSGLDQSQAPQLQSQVNAQGLPELNSEFQNLPSMSTDFSADTQRTQQAVFDRALGMINPEYDRRQRGLETQLANQGLPMGSEAYNDEMTRFQKGRDEAELAAALSAVQAGSQEQGRLFGQSLQARQQGVGEQMGEFGMAQDARSQLYGEGLTNTQLNNQARQQALGEQVTDADLAARARNSGFNEQVTQNQMSNQARQQGVNEQLQDAGLSQTARQQGLSERQLMRNQPYNELAMLMGQNPSMQTMNAPQTAQYQMAPTDVIGAEQLAYQGNLNNYNAQMNQNNAKKGGMTNLAGTVASNLPWGQWFG